MSKHPKKRWWVQIHLGTAIVLMFVAGALLWANVRVYDLALPPRPGELVRFDNAAFPRLTPWATMLSPAPRAIMMNGI